MATERIAQPSANIRDRLMMLATRLGYANRGGFIVPSRLRSVPTYRHALDQAFSEMAVVACYGFLGSGAQGFTRFTPLVYMAAAKTPSQANAIHRIVWSQGVVPLLLIGLPEGVQVRTGFNYRSRVNFPLTPWAEALERTETLPRNLQPLSALALAGSLGWKDFSPNPRERVDSHLLKDITALSYALRSRFPQLKARPDLINALIGRMMYLYVLIDRRLINQSWVKSLCTQSGKPACPTLQLDQSDPSQLVPPDSVWPADEVWRLFDHIDEVLNGAVFPITHKDRKALTADAIHFVRRVIRYRDVVQEDSHQYSFLDVSFAALRTETISAIYEQFLKLEDAGKKVTSGAFYTPPYLVDYMIDEADAIRPLNRKAKVLDPAAGSGAFLVGAYRRILERSMPKRGWKIKDLPKLRKLLTDCIFGIEEASQATNIVRFSLYLTLLDYLRGVSIADIQGALSGERLFPQLNTNILWRDFFSDKIVPNGFPSGFSHVLGNPPWTEMDIKEDSPARRYRASLSKEDNPIDQNRLAELFVWRVINKMIRPSGVIGLLLSTKCFVSPGANKFPKALARRVRISGIANLWHFRYRLFISARNPAAALFAQADLPNAYDPVWVYAPLLTSQPIATNAYPWAIVADRGDVTHFKLRDIAASSDTWFHALMLQPLDRRNARAAYERSQTNERTLRAFLESSGMTIGRGGSPQQTGLPKDYLLGTDKNKINSYYRIRLGIEKDWDNTYELPQNIQARLPGGFRTLFGGDALLIPRSMNHFDVVEQPAAFTSSINAIVYEHKESGAREQRLAALRGLAAYLKSEVAEYLFALFGRMWLLDGRRFEKNDLYKLPVPFKGLDDPVLRMIPNLDQTEITSLFVETFGFDRWFVEAVREFVEFRSGYQDAQVPKTAYAPPSEAALNRYVEALNAYLVMSFGPEANIELVRNLEVGESLFEELIVTIGLRADTSVEPISTNVVDVDWTFRRHSIIGPSFNDSSEVRFDPSQSCVELVKPLTRSAWTTDRAYADSVRIVEQVAKS